VTARRDTGILAPFRSLLGAQVAGTALGLLFWVVVARLVPGTDVGVAAAAISTQTLLGTATALGLGTLLIAELPRHSPGRQRQLVLRALVAVALAGLLVGGLVAVLGHGGVLGGNLRAATSGAGAIVLVAGVVAAGWALVLDEAVLGLQRSRVQVVRNVVAAGLRFPLAAGLLLAGHRDATVLMACWVLPLLVSIGGAFATLRLPRTAGGPAVGADLTSYAGAALRHHGLNLALAAGSQLMPVVAAVTLSAVANAEFAIAWLAATFVFLPPYLLAVALFAHGSRVTAEELRTSMATTLPAALGLSLLLCLGAWVLGRPALHVFGAEYAAQSWTLLALLVPAGLWMVVKDHLVALWRVERRFAHATRLAGAAVLLEVSGAAIGGALAGGTGLALGWLAAITLELLLTLPLLRRTFGGLPWQRPWRRRVLVTSERGASSWAFSAAALVLAIAVGFGVFAARGGSSGVEAEPVADAVACPPTVDRPGPLLDLGVQAATGDPAHPVRDQAEVDRLVDLAVGAGAAVISTSVDWAESRPTAEGGYDWTAVDRVVDSARARGLQVRVQLSGLPGWARDGRRGYVGDPEWRPPLSDAELRGWSGFVTDALTHLRGRVAYAETWAEPDNPDFWATGPDPAAFARLLTTTYDAVRASDPAVRVISGSLAGNDLGFLAKTYDALDATGRTAAAGRPFDLVGLHPYTNGAGPLAREPESRFTGPFGTVDESFLGYRDVHALMTERGDGDLPVYIGEIGFSTAATDAVSAVPDDTRAVYLGQVVGAATCTAYVEVVSWYYLHPTPWNPASWTLLDEQLQPTETYRALVQWSRAVKDVS